MNVATSCFRNSDRSSSTLTRSSTTSFATTSPALASSGTSPRSPPRMTIGRPGDLPSAADRMPHWSPFGSTITTCWPALTSCSTSRRIV